MNPQDEGFEMSEDDNIVVVVKRHGHYRWYRSDREYWIFDWRKWEESFVAAGCTATDFDPMERFGIEVVDDETCDEFLRNMANFEISQHELAEELKRAYSSSKSWWDIPHLFPVLFVSFDEHRLLAFYHFGAPLEKYAPQGWDAHFTDFTSDLPSDQKYWVLNGVDLLKSLSREV